MLISVRPAKQKEETFFLEKIIKFIICNVALFVNYSHSMFNIFTRHCLLCLADYLNRVSITFFVIEHIAAKRGTPRYPIWQQGVPLESKRESCALPRKELRHGNAQPIADPLNRVDR